MEPHKIIYLQFIDAKETPGKFITWCQDQINESDIEYVRKDKYDLMCKHYAEQSGSCPVEMLLGWELPGGCMKKCKNQAAECRGIYFLTEIIKE